MRIDRVNPQQMSDEELHAFHRFARAMREESSPDDPSLPFEHFVSRITNIPSFVEVAFWLVRTEDDCEVLARATVIESTGEDNQHLAQYEIGVLPAYRRRGIGTTLLRLGVRRARERGRRLLGTYTFSTVPSGSDVMHHLGAQVGLESKQSELRLEEVDRGLMRSWIERAQDRAADFELAFWVGRYPEDRLEEVASMLNAFNSQPTGDLEVEDRTYTVEDARSLDDMWEARGFTKWTCIVREPETGTVAGFTEVFINRHEPEKIEQGLTAVFPPYRNRGIGRWLKAAVVDKVLAEAPEATVIVTDNATINEPMLNINREMGFRLVKAETVWQVSLDEVESYLAARGGDGPASCGQ